MEKVLLKVLYLVTITITTTTTTTTIITIIIIMCQFYIAYLTINMLNVKSLVESLIDCPLQRFTYLVSVEQTDHTTSRSQLYYLR